MSKIAEIENQQLVTAGIKDWVSEIGNSIFMPRIQRGFVWNPLQIATLWDSVLRGMPFGTLMVMPINAPIKVKDEKHLKLDEVQQGWQLLDGQQRSRSLQGGFSYSNDSSFRIWLGVNKSKHSDLLFDFKVTTNKHPFGYAPNFKPYALSTRRKAFEQHGEKHVSLESSKPYSPQEKDKYIPLDKILRVVYPELNKEHSQDHRQDRNQAKPPQDLKTYLCDQFGISDDDECLIDEIVEGFYRLKATKVFAQSVESSFLDFDKAQNKEDHLAEPGIEILFKRVGSAGTSLSNIDYAYSLIKQEIPEAYEFVEGAVHNGKIKDVFSPIDLISIALRICCAEVKQQNITNKEIKKVSKDSDSYSKSDVSRIMASSVNRPMLEKLLSESKLVEAISDVITALEYDPERNPNGLSRSLLSYIPMPLWQSLVYWQFQRDCVHEQQRELIKFILYWLTSSPRLKEPRKLSISFFKLMADSELNQTTNISDFAAKMLAFDGGKRFKPLVGSEQFRTLTIESEITFNNRKNEQGKSVIRGNKTRYSDETEPSHAIGRSFWKNKKLLLWFQRKYLYDMLSNESSKIAPDITPYDFDHIIPQNYWSNLNTNKGTSFNAFVCNKFGGWRPHRELGNSIGNYQLLTFSENRAKQHDDYNQSTKDVSIAELTYNYKIGNKAHQYFKNTVTGEQQSWKQHSVMNFQFAVEQRVCELYQELVSLYQGDDVYLKQNY